MNYLNGPIPSSFLNNRVAKNEKAKHESLTNKVDQCMQCSTYGPDVILDYMLPGQGYVKKLLSTNNMNINISTVKKKSSK